MNSQAARPRVLQAAIVDITPEMLLELLKVPSLEDQARYRVHGDGTIPNDAKALRAGITSDGNVRLIIESSKFDIVPEGNSLPRLIPQYTVQDRGV